MAKKTHRTYRGRPIDIDALIMMNQKSVAVGNANMNARGDILGKGGIIVKTKEAVAEEYYQQQVHQTVKTNEAPAVHKPAPTEIDELVTTPRRKPVTKKVSKDDTGSTK